MKDQSTRELFEQKRFDVLQDVARLGNLSKAPSHGIAGTWNLI